ncbi:MAG: DsbA family protein [Nitrospinota bacterium]
MKKNLFFVLMLFLSLQTASCTGGAESNKDVNDLKKIIEARHNRPSNTRRTITGGTGTNGDPFMGNTDAPLVVVEFSDYECPFCGRFFRETLQQIKKEYVKTGKVKYVYKDFPLNFHKKAPKAAEAAHCAGEKGKFWEMHDLLFENQMRLDIPSLINHGDKLGLNLDDFKKCISDGRYMEGIKKDIEAGKNTGLRGTPSFVIGKQNKNGEVTGDLIVGAAPFKAFKAAIDAMLSAK